MRTTQLGRHTFCALTVVVLLVGARPLVYAQQPIFKAPFTGTAVLTQGNFGPTSHNTCGSQRALFPNDCGWENTYALDFRLSAGTPVLAMAAGEITYVDTDPAGMSGRQLAITTLDAQGQRYTIVFLHLQQILRSSGFVMQGERVALSGNSSFGDDRTTDHLHVHLWGAEGTGLQRDSHTSPIQHLLLQGSGDSVAREYSMERGELNHSRIFGASFTSNNVEVTCATYPVATGTSGSESLAFVNAFNRAGGVPKLGCATEAVRFDGFTSFAGTAGHFQRLANGGIQYLATSRSGRAGQAWVIPGLFWKKWSSFLFTVNHPLGYPIGDVSPISQASTGTQLQYQQFEGGALEAHLSGPRAGRIFEIHGAIWQEWERIGHAAWWGGLPISDEHDVPGGRASDFERGHIWWKQNAGRAFETHGDIDRLYVSIGGPSSFLGFPTTDEYRNTNQRAQNDFEGGYITTQDGVRYVAVRRTSLYWQQQTTGQLAAWSMQGTVLMDGHWLEPSSVTDTAWKISAVTDISETRSMLVWQHDTAGLLSAWTVEGSRMLEGHGLGPGVVSDTNWRVRALTDLDGDGQSDLIWQHQTIGWIAAWFMNGASLRSGELLYPSPVDLNWRIVGAADFTGDGRSDLLWQHQADGRLAVWEMRGRTLVQGFVFNQVSDPAWVVRSIVDLNRDSKPDLIWQHTSGGWVAAWLMDATTLTSGLALTPDRVPDTRWKIVGPR